MASLIRDTFLEWEAETDARFARLKENEEELNRIFIEMYGLQGELSPAVADKDVTVRRANLAREIRSLLSYAVGCLFGRYSLDREGLCYAGGAWDATLYPSLPPVKDNLFLLGKDDTGENDLLDGIVRFLVAVYGEETLEENLAFIALALGGKGESRQVIRRYLRQDFYKDHVKIYRKHPIYWQLSSGKQGFRALFYLHRYTPALLTEAVLRVECLLADCRREQAALAAALSRAHAEERLGLRRKQEALDETEAELVAYLAALRPMAEKGIVLSLDDGVAANYEKLSPLLTPIE